MDCTEQEGARRKESNDQIHCQTEIHLLGRRLSTASETPAKDGVPENMYPSTEPRLANVSRYRRVPNRLLLQRLEKTSDSVPAQNKCMSVAEQPAKKEASEIRVRLATPSYQTCGSKDNP